MNFDFRAELNGLAGKIERNPLLELLAFEVGAPVTEESITDAEARFGAPLPAPLRRLYRSLGSATLRWRFKPDLDEQTRGRLTEEFAEAVTRHNLSAEAGAIGIVPLEDMLFNEEYTPLQIESEGEFDFDGTVYSDNEFCGMLRHFDTINDFFAMSFVVQPGRADWKMMFLGHYWIEYDHSRVTYLEDYLRYVIATWGLVNARDELFSEHRGDRREPLRYDSGVAAARIPAILLTR